MHENDIAEVILGVAIKIHKDLGPGLLESVYERILEKQLINEGLNVERQVSISFEYDDDLFEDAFIADLVINGKVILELKSIDGINNAHKKQLLTYLKLTNIKLGFILNFGEALMKNGITRCINGSL